MASEKRRFLHTLAELIDHLTIDQIKMVMIPEHKESVAQELEKLAHDIDLIIEERGLKLSARLIRIIIVIAQMNLHLWHNKDKMQHEPTKYTDLLKLAHQLKGIRNQ